MGSRRNCDRSPPAQYLLEQPLRAPSSQSRTQIAGALQHEVEVSGALLQVPESDLSCHGDFNNSSQNRVLVVAINSATWRRCSGEKSSARPAASKHNFWPTDGLHWYGGALCLDLLSQLCCLCHRLSTDDLKAGGHSESGPLSLSARLDGDKFISLRNSDA